MAIRGLNPSEVALATRVFHWTISYGEVLIADDLGLEGRPYTIPRWGTSGDAVMHLGPIGFASALSAGQPRIFIHELTHVWQYQHHGTGYITDSAWEQLWHGANAYSYTPGLPWSAYHAEQQAHIVEDWFAGGMLWYDPRFLYILNNIWYFRP